MTLVLRYSANGEPVYDYVADPVPVSNVALPRAPAPTPVSAPSGGGVAAAPQTAVLLSSQTPQQIAQSTPGSNAVCPSNLFNNLQYKEYKSARPFQGRFSWVMSERPRLGYYWYILIADGYSDNETENCSLWMLPPGNGPNPAIDGKNFDDPFFGAVGGAAGNQQPPASGVRIDPLYGTAPASVVKGIVTRLNGVGALILPSDWALLVMTATGPGLAGNVNNRYLRIAYIEMQIGQEPPAI